jgi:hypothetical protein
MDNPIAPSLRLINSTPSPSECISPSTESKKKADRDDEPDEFPARYYTTEKRLEQFLASDVLHIATAYIQTDRPVPSRRGWAPGPLPATEPSSNGTPVVRISVPLGSAIPEWSGHHRHRDVEPRGRAGLAAASRHIDVECPDDWVLSLEGVWLSDCIIDTWDKDKATWVK